MSLRTPLCQVLGIEHPIIQAPIGGAAVPALAAAVSEAGALGMLTMSNAGPSTIRQRIADVRARTTRPFGVNLILEHEQREQLDTCLAEGVALVSYFWRRFEPGDPYVEEAHAAGALVTLTVGSSEDARRAVDAGVDVVVAQGIEAGGHVWGTVATLPLVPAVVDAVAPEPVVAAGGVADGRGLAAVLALGAQAAWMGTRFLLTEESPVHPDHAQLALEASESDTALSSLFDGGWPDAPHRTLVNSTMRAWLAAGSPPPGQRPGEGEIVGRSPTGEPIERYAVNHPTIDRVAEGSAETMALYAGQSVGLVRERLPAAEVIGRVVADAEHIVASLAAPAR
jgi:nitronate monooxygenase